MASKNAARVRCVPCPVCGAEVEVLGAIGRPSLNIPVKKIYDSLRITRSIRDTAEELECSRGYIYGVLKTHHLTLDDVLARKTEVRVGKA